MAKKPELVRLSLKTNYQPGDRVPIDLFSPAGATHLRVWLWWYCCCPRRGFVRQDLTPEPVRLSELPDPIYLIPPVRGHYTVVAVVWPEPTLEAQGEENAEAVEERARRQESQAEARKSAQATVRTTTFVVD